MVMFLPTVQWTLNPKWRQPIFHTKEAQNEICHCGEKTTSTMHLTAAAGRRIVQNMHGTVKYDGEGFKFQTFGGLRNANNV